MDRPTLHWQALVGGGAGLVLIVGGTVLPAPIGLPAAAVGGCLIGVALAAWHWRSSTSGAPPPSPRTEPLESVTAALQAGVQELYSLVDLSRMLSASLDLDYLLSTALKTVAVTANIEGYCLFLLDESGDRLVARTAGGRGSEALRGSRLAPGEGLAGRVLRTGSPEAHESRHPFPWPDVPANARSVLAVPLLSQRKSIGVLTLFTPVPAAFGERGLAFFAAVANQLAAAVENAKLYHRTQELSYRDGLTGLFNRRHFEETLTHELHRAERYRMPLSLIMIDIDHFKQYNDTHGHVNGDRALKAVATMVVHNTRRADIAVRYGGEEMALILPLTPKHPARVVAEKLRLAVEGARLDVGRLTMSLGVATYPEDGASAAELVKAADDALYAAKQAGRNRVEVFANPG